MERDIEAGGRGVEGDEHFHAAVTPAGHSALLERLMGEISDLIRETRIESLSQPGRPRDSLAGHHRHRRRDPRRRPAGGVRGDARPRRQWSATSRCCATDGMDLGQVLAVLGAGFGAGFVMSAVGAGSLVSFPILLGVGLSPLVANVSNNVGMVPGGMTGSFGYRRELAGHRHLVVRVALTAAAGALVGAGLLLALPSTAFECVVPFLVLAHAPWSGASR